MISKERPIGFSPAFEVAACFCEHDGKVLFLKRHSKKDYGGFWNLPAGKLEKGETAEQAVIREVKEETGINLQGDQIIRIQTYYDTYPEYMYLFHTFLAHVGSKEVEIKDDEAVDFTWLKPVEALRIDLVPDEDYCIKDAFGLD